MAILVGAPRAWNRMDRARPPCWRFVLTLTSLLLTSAGCAQVAPLVQPPRADAAAIQTEAAFEQEAALERLRGLDQRVTNVGYRLRLAGRPLCSATAPLAGFSLHDARQYGPGSRAVAMAYFHLGLYPAVLAVAKDSPAERAGLRNDDALTAVNDQSLAAPALADDDISRTPATYDTQARAWSLIDQQLSKGPVRLSVLRQGQSITLTLASEKGCAYDILQEASDDLDASADGQRVFITSGMTRYAISDDQLAVLLSHELAHDLLGHQRRLAKSGVAGAVLGNLGADPATLMQMEREADYVGLYLDALAGYDINAAEVFWRQFGADYPASQYAQGAHPGSLERVVNMRLTVAEIRAKQRAGQPLRPNPAPPPRSAS